MTTTLTADRQRRQRVLALSEPAELERRWQALALPCRYHLVRGPETGLALLRGRIGGTGNAFNLGETTLTRASVMLEGDANSHLGHGWVQGRDKRHAELIALVDACAHQPQWAALIEAELLAPLHSALEQRRLLASRRTAATRVDFFTLVRGDSA
jgi:alpha-D-ribose 1-methylphosphonate 5-triphosphate synthase subunit PhnG